MDLQQYNKSSFKGAEIREAVKLAESLRGGENPVDVTFEELIKDKYSLTLDSYLHELGIDPNYDSINMLYTMPDDNVRWLIPEIYRAALRLGLRKAPIWPNVTAMEEQARGLSNIMPWVNMSDADPKRVGEAETIPVGTLSYGQKKFSIYKIGRGIKIPYEVTQYVSLNVISIFLQDFGSKLGMAMDTLVIDCLQNGEQADLSESAPVIGVIAPNSKIYKDLLKIWVRMSRIGRTPTTIIGGETSGLETLLLPEFRNPTSTGAPLATLDLKTPVPNRVNYFIHGRVADGKEIMVDPSSAIIKLNAQPLLVESEKIVSNQTNAFYATLTTGFAKLFKDASIILDSTKQYPTDPTQQYGLDYYSYLDVDPLEIVEIN